METEKFYSGLPVYDNFTAVSDLSSYAKLPSDWLVVVADVQNSTEAIREGQYKAVNITGVSVITAVSNAAKPILLPYIFGGDGATMCIPPSLVTKADQALIATREMARQQFNLNLRIGIIPVAVIEEAGHQVLVARHRVSDFYVQAAFTGGGVEYAENMLKNERSGKKFQLSGNDGNAKADYGGLECRWDQVHSQHGETIALIVKASPSSMEAQSAVYYEIIETIRRIYGNDEICRPVYSRGLRFAGDNVKLGHELKVRTFRQDKKAVLKHWLIMRMQIILGRILMSAGIRIGGISWGHYKRDVVRNTDFKKFDGVLREVISGTQQQRVELQRYLEQRRKAKDCVYGIHVSDSAMVTCMINNRSGEHFHFVDGADGGYALAATKMKQQLKESAGLGFSDR